MDLDFSAEEREFQSEVREWLNQNLPADWRNVSGFDEGKRAEEIRRLWQTRLNEGGWFKLGWPLEQGGRGGTAVMQSIFQEELAVSGAPPILGSLGVTLLVPVLMAHGTDWQKSAYVEKILSGEIIFCQGFSEPNAGSDLASLSTRAERRNGHWVINGQKVWSSGGHHAHRSFLLARTEQSSRPHEGIGYFLVDMQQPGVEVRKIRQLTGGQEFCEIFLADAKVDERDVVGAPTDGWRLAMTTFGHERGGLANAARFESAVQELVRILRDSGKGHEGVTRQQVAQAYIEARVFRALSLRVLSRAQRGAQAGPEASIVKLYWSEMDKRLRDLGVAIQGMQGALAIDSETDSGGAWRRAWLWSLAETIYAGTSEIQRNIIAERVLSLPRSR